MDFLASQMNLALDRGDVEGARGWLEAMPEASPLLATGLNENALQLYRLKFKQRTSAAPATDEEIARLLSWHQKARSFGRHDEHVSIMWVALTSRGRDTEASDLLRHYLTHFRRERRGVTEDFYWTTRLDPVWRDAELPQNVFAGLSYRGAPRRTTVASDMLASRVSQRSLRKRA
jgi:hypothetical protein